MLYPREDQESEFIYLQKGPGISNQNSPSNEEIQSENSGTTNEEKEGFGSTSSLIQTLTSKVHFKEPLNGRNSSKQHPVLVADVSMRDIKKNIHDDKTKYATFAGVNQNEINYKLMQKCPPQKHQMYDFTVLQKAFQNLETDIPVHSKTHLLVSQRQIVESLEQAIKKSKIHREVAQDDLYRLILKIYQKFMRQIQPYTKYDELRDRVTCDHTLDQQVQTMIRLLNAEIVHIQSLIQSKDMYQRFLLQKGFLSFLDHICPQNTDRQLIQSQEFDMHKETLGLKKISFPQHEVSFRIEQKSKQNSMQSLQMHSSQTSLASQQSPEQKRYQRLQEKQNSPVRQFLNNDDLDITDDKNDPYKQSLGEFRIQMLPEMVQISSIFDNKNANDSQRNQSVLSGQVSLSNLVQAPPVMLSQEDILARFQSAENYKIALKCMRIWKIYAKQEVLRREQALILDAQKAQKMEKEIASELELSQEIAIMKNEFAIALNHYENRLMSQALHGLIDNIFRSKKDMAKLRKLLRVRKDLRMVEKCYTRWHRVAKKLVKGRKRCMKYETYYQDKLKGLFVRQILKVILTKRRNTQNFIAKREQATKRMIFQEVLVGKILVRVWEKDQKIQALVKRYNRGLKEQSFKAIYAQNEEFKLKMKKVRRHAKLYRLSALFQIWADITAQHYHSRQASMSVEALNRKNTIQQHFIAWQLLSTQISKCENFRSHQLAKKTMNGFEKYIKIKERKQLVLSACVQHLQKFKQKQVYKGWKAQIKSQVKYRQFQLDVFDKMDLFRQRQIYKQWFNLIDILKRWRFLTENTEAWADRKTRKRVFGAWRNQVRLGVLYFKVHDKHVEIERKRHLANMFQAAQFVRFSKQIHVRSIHFHKKHILKRWISVLGRKHIRRIEFRNTIIRKTKYRAFKAIRKVAAEKIVFRQSLKRLLKLRAQNLLRQAFKQGLKKMWHVANINKNRELIAECVYKRKLYKEALGVLVRPVKLKQLGKKMKQRHFQLMKINHMRKWYRRFYETVDADKFHEVQLSKMKRKIFTYFRDDWEYKINDRKVKKEYYLQRAFNKLAANRDKRQGKREHYEHLMSHAFYPYLKRKTFRYIALYASNKRTKRETLVKAEQIYRTKVLLNCWTTIANHSEIQSRLKFFTKKRLMNSKNNCFQTVARYSFGRAKGRLYFDKVMRRLVVQAFDGLKRFKEYRTYWEAVEQEMTQKDKTAIKVRTLKKLVAYKNRTKIDKKRTAQVHKLVAGRYTMMWKGVLAEAVEEGEERHLAQELFKKHMFGKLQRACKVDKKERRLKSHLLQKQRQFYEFTSKRRFIRQLVKNFNEAHFNRIKGEYALKIQAKRVFNAWKEALHHFKRKRILRESAELMRNNALSEKAIMALRLYADRKIKDGLILDRFQERSELARKAEILIAFHENIQFKKNQRIMFYHKMVPVAEKRMGYAVLMWKTFVHEQRLENKASQFFMKRSAQYLKRIVWDSFRIFKIHQVQKDVQAQAVHAWYSKLLLQKTWISLKLYLHDERRLNNVKNIIGIQSDLGLKRKYFQALQIGVANKTVKDDLKRRAVLFYKHNVYRKCLISFQMTQFKGSQVITLKKRVDARIKREFMMKWYNKLLYTHKMNKFVQVLQNEDDQRMVHKFLPNLVKETYNSQVLDHMTQKRIQAYQQQFIDELRKKILMRKILKSFRLRHKIDFQRQVFMELRMNSQASKMQKSMIVNHIDDLEENQAFDILQIAFNCLKERAIKKKFKNFSINCYKLRQLKKYWMALHQNSLKNVMFQQKEAEVRKIQEAKYLWHWRQAYFKEVEKNQVKTYVQQLGVFQVFNAWRGHINQKVQVRHFHNNVTRRNKLSHIWIEWQKHIQRQKKMNLLKAEGEKLSKYWTERRFLVTWIQTTHANKIYSQMAQFSNLKIQRDIFSVWRMIKSTRNLKRQRIHRIGQVLKERPELGRPLKAMKNRTLFKAFNKLCEASTMVFLEDQQTEDAQFRYYLNMAKKTFLSLRLNAQVENQNKDVDEIANLFLQKRWLNYMKLGTVNLKLRRRERQKASVCRFLALQRKAFEALVAHSMGRQEIRIKRNYAMQLYYKRLLDKAFSALRVHRNQRTVRFLLDQDQQQQEDRQNQPSESESPFFIQRQNGQPYQIYQNLGNGLNTNRHEMVLQNPQIIDESEIIIEEQHDSQSQTLSANPIDMITLGGTASNNNFDNRFENPEYQQYQLNMTPQAQRPEHEIQYDQQQYF